VLFNIQKDKATQVKHTENVQNIGVLNHLKKIKPGYLDHVLKKNEVIIAFAKSNLGGIEFLELPVCGHCEKPGAWHTDDSCYCWACGTTTRNAITLYEYLAQELKLTEEDVKILLEISGTDIHNEIILDGGLKA
jgi:hypothetical protein